MLPPSLPPLAPPPPSQTPEELQSELARVQRQRLLLEQREKQLLRALGLASAARMSGLLAHGGLAPAELARMMKNAVGTSARTALAAADPLVRKAPIRFRHPEQPGLVWSGRGKKPLWIQALEAEGRIEVARVAGPA